ncbi:MAG: ScpA family protein [Patescibacteria group bacterium]
MESAYRVKTGSFEGPMELLLSLIEKRKLFINEISIAEVTNDYLSYIKNLGEFSLSRTANFIMVAATLILIKSRSLLPELKLTEEEEAGIDNLEERLTLYRIVRDASVKIKELLAGPTIWERPFVRNRQIVFSPDPKFTITNISAAIASVVNNLPKKEAPLPKVVVKKVISIEEMIESITKRIEEGLKTSFKKLSGHSDKIKSKEEKVYIIVGFLAMLELVKQGIVLVEQHNNFEDISIKTNHLQLTTDPSSRDYLLRGRPTTNN